MDYKKAGVDIGKGENLVAWLKTAFLKQSLGSDFCSYFPFPVKNYKNPVLVSSADGVGTKVKLASYYGEWDTVGQDLVAMCVNDLLCSGAKPLFFLDYYGCGHLKTSQAQAFLKGLNRACEEAQCPLVGGETAELPGLYRDNEFDCAGFALGVVEKENILGPHCVKPGDDILALKSSGFHSNGYSLLRKLYDSPKDLAEKKEILMEPTTLYTFLVPFFKKFQNLKAIAHITGGGLNNISRIIPEGLTAELNLWDVPSCFLEVKERGGLSWESLLTTFNCGLGLVLILSDKERFLKKNLISKDKILDLGCIVKNEKSSVPGERWFLNLRNMEKRHAT